MSMYVTDAGTRCLVKATNLDAAYEWLKEAGEFANKVGTVMDCAILSADGNEDFFCGEVSYYVGELIEEFLDKFCEPGSYVCQRNDDYFQYDLYWKDGTGVHSEGREFMNPFESMIEELERKF